jgi:glycosyltransferase involved in cell wall biosynthesis
VRIVALIAAFNEERFIGNALRHLVEQGCEVYVIDNQSTDATREIVESFRGRGVCGVEVLPRRGTFDWAAIVRRKEQLHLELAGDWYIHHDADTIVQAPKPHRTLAEGLAAVDRAGDNAVNFDEFLFMPTGPDDDHDDERYVERMRQYVYLAQEPRFRINAWKNFGQRIRLEDGGHRVAFAGSRLHPEPFILRHYIALSPAHAARKYGQRVFRHYEVLRGWHGKRSTLRADNLAYPDPATLRTVTDDNTWDRSAPVREEPLLANAPDPALWRRKIVRRVMLHRRRVARVARRVPGLWSFIDPSGYPQNRVALKPGALADGALRNVLVLGSGRSGTSMVTALFRNSGYFMGFDLLGGSPANLHGYYEDTGITEINNLLLRWMLHWPWARFIPGVVPAAHRDPRSLWLAAPRRRRTRGELMNPLVRLMDAYARRQPFCYKDPRFSVTLPLWERFLPIGTRRIVVFRDPDQTVDSILRDVRETYDPPLPISARWAYTAWLRNYSRLLESVDRGGPAVFARYEDVVSGAALPMLAKHTNAEIDAGQVDQSASRAESVRRNLRVASRCRELHLRLCRRADDDLERHR